MNPLDVCLAIEPLDCCRILEMLEQKKIYNAEVARILNINRQTVHTWKTGNHPSELNGRRLMKLFKLYYPDEPIPEVHFT